MGICHSGQSQRAYSPCVHEVCETRVVWGLL